MREWGRGAASVLLAILALVAFAACRSGAQTASAEAEQLDIFAAASLTGVLTELGGDFENETGIDVRLHFAGSASLREQLLDGAEADLFISANQAIADEVVDRLGLDTPRIVATNEIALAVPAAEAALVPSLASLTDDELFVGRCAAGVPCGDLTDAVIAMSGLDIRFDSADSDVYTVAGRLLDGELDAAFVYRSDVVASDGQLVAVELADAPTTNYPMVVLSASAAVSRFEELVTSEAGRRVLAQWGFGSP